jgi:hypothetical protein
MPNSGDALNASLRVGLAVETGMIIAADKQAIIARQQQEIAMLRESLSSSSKKSTADFDLLVAQREIELLKTRINLKDDAIREKNALILDWMHSNEAFKMLAKIFGKKLGESDESIWNEFDQCILNIAEKYPIFQKSRLQMKTKKALSK